MNREYGPSTSDTDDIEAILGEVQASPTQYTVLDRLKSIVTALGTTLLTKIVGNDAVLQGNITLSGSAQQVHASTASKNVTIQAHPDNAGYVYVGTSSVSTTVHMAVLSAGSSQTFYVSNLNLLYVRGTASDLVSYGGEV